MSAAIIVALIALVGAIANVGLSYVLNARSDRRRAEERADATWRRYRISLADAAYELQARLYSIFRLGYLERSSFAYGIPGESRQDEVLLSTLFRFAQYFGWSEIMRRALRAPERRFASDSEALVSAMTRVRQAFASDTWGPGPFMVWSEAQRAIGELMITHDGEVTDTIGVTTFFADFQKLRPWLGRIEAGLKTPDNWTDADRARLGALIDGLGSVIESPSRFVQAFPQPVPKV